MLRYADELAGYELCATDGAIGSIAGFFFDEQTWTARYFIARTGKWLLERQVLISPIAFGEIDDEKRIIRVRLKRFRIGNSPSVNLHRPVSRQYEINYHRYYGWPAYWGAEGRWGNECYPSELFTVATSDELPASAPRAELDTALLNANGMNGFGVFAGDTRLGAVESFLIDDRTWAVSYILVDASAIEQGRKVLVSPHWIGLVAPAEKMVTVELPLEMIRNSPAFDRSRPVSRDYELRLFKHYGDDRNIDALKVGRKVPA